MQKRSMEALGRLSVEAFRQADKLPVVLALDNVRSGLNVGSVFRTADAFLLEKIILCGISPQPPHREILKTALGSTDSVDWQYFPALTQAIEQYKKDGYGIWALEQTDSACMLHAFEWTPDKKCFFILGNEVNGVSEEALALCDGAVEIPQFGTKHSLNVAVAAGVLCWELARRRIDISTH